MGLAATADVVDALGRALTAQEQVQVSNLIEQASDLIIGYLGYTPNPVPGAVKRVAATMVAAVFTKPAVTVADYDATGYATARESTNVQIGTESVTTEGPWLTNSLKMRLKPFRTSVWSVEMVSESFGAES
jgi:hypothetical protein